MSWNTIFPGKPSTHVFPFLPHVHPFFHPFYSQEIAWESFIPRKWKPMILNKIPYFPLPFSLNFSLLFPLIFSPMIFVVFINCLLFEFWISLFSSRITVGRKSYDHQQIREGHKRTSACG